MALRPLILWQFPYSTKYGLWRHTFSWHSYSSLVRCSLQNGWNFIFLIVRALSYCRLLTSARHTLPLSSRDRLIGARVSYRVTLSLDWNAAHTKEALELL